jgi:hypothetical protein
VYILGIGQWEATQRESIKAPKEGERKRKCIHPPVPMAYYKFCSSLKYKMKWSLLLQQTQDEQSEVGDFNKAIRNSICISVLMRNSSIC